jgi:hypothetical protein
MAEKIYDVVEIKKLVSAKLKKEFPKYKFSITTRRGGSGKIYINWYSGDFYPFKEPNVDRLSLNHFYIKDDERITYGAMRVMQKVKDITDEYNWDNSDPMTDYFDVNFYLDLYIGTSEKPFKVVSSSSKPPTSTNAENSDTTISADFDKGKLLRKEAGWSAYKKLLPDGRIVYNAFKNKETAANKDDWDVIKGEVYIESGFKWSKYGFSKWGSLSNEDVTLDSLFNVLKKYYQAPVIQEESFNAPQNYPNISYEDIKEFKAYVRSFYGVNGVYKDTYNGGFSAEKIDKAVDDYILLSNDWGGGDARDRLNVLNDYLLKDTPNKFIYGAKWDVPLLSGQIIVDTLIGYGYTVEIPFTDFIKIHLEGYPKMMINDNGGEFNLLLIGEPPSLTHITNIPYSKVENIVSPLTLAFEISEIYREQFIIKPFEENNDLQKQQVQTSITALQYLADAGDEDAKTAITALQYLL